MSRKRTGLSNRYRQGGVGPYSRKRKSKVADRYGEYKGRACVRPDSINGHPLHATKDFEAAVTR